MKWKEFAADYLNFSRKDRIAIIVILSIVLAVFFLPEAFSKNASLPNNSPPDTAWIAALKRLEQKEAGSSDVYRQYPDDNSSTYQYDRRTGGYTENSKGELFYFDPNNLSREGWLRLGLREKTVRTIQNYLSKGGQFRKPVFVPEASIQAIQPIEQNFHFEGFYAPTILFQDPCSIQQRSKSLGNPEVFQLLSYAEPFSQTCNCDAEIIIAENGQLNALRLITKNILAINMHTCSTVDWHTQYIIVPLSMPLSVSKGDQISIRFSYQGGAPLNALSDSLEVCLVNQQIPVLELALEALNRTTESQSTIPQMQHY